jgi:transcriptional regulator with XRE-family HTH domain
MNVGTPGFNGEKLVEARRARGLTAVALSEMIGVTSQSISGYEKGKQSPRPDTLEAIAFQLNMPISYFLRESYSPEDGPIF